MIVVKPVLKLLSRVRVQMLNILSKLMLTLKLPQAALEPETESIRPRRCTDIAEAADKYLAEFESGMAVGEHHSALLRAGPCSSPQRFHV